jgi:hypothetical protein
MKSNVLTRKIKAVTALLNTLIDEHVELYFKAIEDKKEETEELESERLELVAQWKELEKVTPLVGEEEKFSQRVNQVLKQIVENEEKQKSIFAKYDLENSERFKELETEIKQTSKIWVELVNEWLMAKGLPTTLGQLETQEDIRKAVNQTFFEN